MRRTFLAVAAIGLVGLAACSTEPVAPGDLALLDGDAIDWQLRSLDPSTMRVIAIGAERARGQLWAPSGLVLADDEGVRAFEDLEVSLVVPDAQLVRAKLDEVTERWGVKVTTVEIREILPPKDVQDAMTRQMSAERTRRAVVTEADGKKQATITVAEGDKQSAILRAEGDRQAAVLRAEGFSLALDKIFSVAQNVDSKTMALQYLDTLKALGAGSATKFIFPMEFTRLLGPLGDMVAHASGGDKESGKG